MIVKSKAIPIKHNGQRYLAGEEFSIDKEDYNCIANHLDVVDEEDKPAKKKPPQDGDKHG